MKKSARKILKKANRIRNGNHGWQAEKSAMTRKAILDATIQCIIELGYAQTTTSRIAEYAGVSRGAMMHHFPSRDSVLIETIKYLHDKQVREYSKLMKNIDTPSEMMDREKIATAVNAAWTHINLPSSIAFQEILMASRTDPDIHAVLNPLRKEYKEEFLNTSKYLFPNWDDPSTLETAHDVVHFLLTGMMLSQMKSNKVQRIKRVLEFLTDALENLNSQSSTTHAA